MAVVQLQPSILDERADRAAAMEVWRVLCKQYPAHPWVVGWVSHVVTVQHADIDAYIKPLMRHYAKGFLYSIRYVDYPAVSQLRHQAVLAGGRMLEAFGYERGKWDGMAQPQYPVGLFTQKVGLFANEAN